MKDPSSKSLLGKAWVSLAQRGPLGLGRDVRDYLRWRAAGGPAAAVAALPEPETNLDLNQREMRDLPELLRSRPILLYAEATSRCNLRCFMCRLSFPETTRQTRDHMKLEIFSRLEPLLEPDSRLSLFGLGEPLLNPSFVEMLWIAKERGAFVGLNSNAMLLTERIARAMVELEQDLLVISFSGGTRETYERVITGANYDRVLANLRRLNEIKRERAGEGVPLEQVRPVLQLQFTMMRDNFREIPEMVRLAIELHCAGAVAMPLTIVDPSLADQSILQPELWPEIESAFEAARAVAATAGRPFDLQLPVAGLLKARRDGEARGRGDGPHPDPLPGGEGEVLEPRTQNPELRTQNSEPSTQHSSICYEPWQTFYARDDGTVNTCCYSNRVLGDLKTQTALEIWNGEQYRKFRTRMRSANKPAECRVCHRLLGDDLYDPRVDEVTFYDEL